MKKLQLMLNALLATVLASCTEGKDDKLKSDGTYSTHNYKHPNKAAQAREWEQSPSVPVMPSSTSDPVSANYKQQPAGSAPPGGITVPYQSTVTVADRHYKTQNWMKTAPEPEVAKKPIPDSPTSGH